MMVLEKFLKTSPHLISWVTTHTEQTILSQETVQLPTLVVKVVSLHGTVTTTVIHTVQATLDPLMDISTTCGDTGLVVLNRTSPTQDTTTTLMNSDSAGAKLTKALHRTQVPTHTTTGVTTTTPTTVDRVSTSQLKDTTDTVDTTTSVWITLTHTGPVLETVLE